MLFTDIEGSTGLASSLGERCAGVLEAYHEIVEGAVGAAGGWVDGTAGDGFFVTFEDVSAAGRAAVAMQRRLRTHAWPAAVGQLRVRMDLHVGQVERRARGYVGLEIHRAARVGAAAHGGQLLMTGVAAELLRDVVPSQPLGAHRLKDFPAPTALYCAVIDGRGAGEFPPPRTLELQIGSVPAMSFALIGREHDLGRVRAALQDDGERLVTLLGRGGVGKTSLALAAAHALFAEYAGGVWWVDAHQERDATGLCGAIARTCRISVEGSTEQALISEFGSRGPVLLVLDNLEAISGAGALLERVSARLPNLWVLATSQLPLGGRHERRVQLDRLEGGDALALLSRTAQRLDISLDDDRAGAELVELLDGLPLAIELAAGRLRLFGAAELVRRLRESMSILQDRARPERHRSLAAALEWTLDLLDRDASELFTRLGVFAGPVELEDIEAVTGDGLDVISAAATLADVALLHRVESGDGLVRFGFPEAIREHARQRLDAAGSPAWRRAHAVWQRDLVWPLRIYESADARLVERGHRSAAETRAALAWAWDHDRDLAREIALGRFPLAARAGSGPEARALINRLIADPGEDARVADLVRTHSCTHYVAGGDTRDVEASLVALLPELTDPQARHLCLLNIGLVMIWDRRFEEGLPWIDRALELVREGDPLVRASVLPMKADTLMEAGDNDGAEQVIRASDALAGSRHSSDRNLLRVTRAELASRRGAHAEALDGLGRVLADTESVGDSIAIFATILSLVRAFRRAGSESEMLESAGIATAFTEEEPSYRRFAEVALSDSQTAIDDAIRRLGPSGRSPSADHTSCW
ncbi:MAG TPA: NB-ARC domain-containing protein [Solirubrobacteraceae bacterium]|nr:NB-ARC domain-containing protein [Solirubrobacteraceae bacterium]